MKLAITVMDDRSFDIRGDVLPVTELGIEVEGVGLHHSQDTDEIVAALKDADYVIAGSERYDAETLPLLPKLKLIVRNGVGYDSVDLNAAAKLGIAVCNLPGSNAYSVAEHVLAMMMCLTRHIPQHTQRIKEGRYEPFITRSMHGKIGLVGFGAIARQLAKLLGVFDVEIIAYDPYVSAQDMAACGVKKAGMDELLAACDVVSLHLPVTADNRHLVNAAFIEKMKDGAYFINAARGALVDECALAEALKSGRLSGAGLDVFEQEPLPAGSPLLDVENILLTPHSATANQKCFHTVLGIGAKAVADFHSGREPFHLLNPEYLQFSKQTP